MSVRLDSARVLAVSLNMIWADDIMLWGMGWGFAGWGYCIIIIGLAATTLYLFGSICSLLPFAIALIRANKSPEKGVPT